MKAITLDGFVDQPREWGTGVVTSIRPCRSLRSNGVLRDECFVLTVAPEDNSGKELRVVSGLRRGASPSVRFYEYYASRDGVILLKRCGPFDLTPGRQLDYLEPRDGKDRIWVVISSRSDRYSAASTVGAVRPKRRQEDVEAALPPAEDWFNSQS